MWLVKLQWTNPRIGSSLPPENKPTLDRKFTRKGKFMASGRRGGFDCYLFIKRSEAESFKQLVENQKRRKSSMSWKPQARLVEVTPEDVAHLDLDPAGHKVSTAAPQV